MSMLHGLLLTAVLAMAVQVVGGFAWQRSGSRRLVAAPTSSATARFTKIMPVSPVRSSNDEGIFADEDDDSFKRIVNAYLMSKFKDCQGEECRMFIDRKECEELLTGLLPPVKKAELDREVTSLMKALGATKADDLVDAEEFLDAVVNNSYWKRAGALVVKELIFLDALYDFYHAKRNPSTLNDEEYSSLKEMLTWEGSSVATMTGKEALFVRAVVASKKGQKALIADDKYDALKNELKAAGSWVVTDKTDTLSKLGMDTLLGYLFASY
jgi:hypothetical protein